MNRCGGGRLLQYDNTAWKAGSLTPGDDNDCKDQQFNLDQEINNHLQRVVTSEDTEYLDDSGLSLGETVDDETDNFLNIGGPQVSETILEEQVRTYKEPTSTCPRRDVAAGDNGDALAEITDVIQQINNLEKCSDGTCCKQSVPPNSDYYGHPDRRAVFNENLEKLTQTGVSEEVLTESLLRKYEEWVEIFFPPPETLTLEDVAVKLRCRMCGKYLFLFGVRSKDTLMSSSEGRIHHTLRENDQILRLHQKTDSHQMVMNLFYKLTAHEMKENLAQSILENEEEKYRKTTRYFLIFSFTADKS